MKMAMHPLFTDIFPDEERVDFEKIIAEIPSESILRILCCINAQLVHNKHDTGNQLKLLSYLSRNQTEQGRIDLIENAINFIGRKGEDDAILFSVQFNLEFIHSELSNYRHFPGKDTKAINSETELKFLKAYFAFSETHGETVARVYFESRGTYENRVDHIRKGIWPTFFSQIEAQSVQQRFSGEIKTISFLNYLLRDDRYSKHTQNYLSHYNFTHPWEYVYSVMAITNIGWKKKGNNEWIVPFYVIPSENNVVLLQESILNIEDYKVKYGNEKQNFNGIKARPIFKFDGDTNFCVIHWNLLPTRFFDGIIFDFYEKSGISKEEKFPSILDFKSHIASEVSEKTLLRKIFEVIYPSKEETLLFSSDSEIGKPDVYFRRDNKIILLEFKDSTFAGMTATSLNYAEILNALDMKYNKPNKGTGQLIKYLKTISNGGFENLANSGSNDFTIYPVIIYTDKFFGVPGINDYLADEFDSKLTVSGLRPKFNSIKRLVCMDFNELLVCCKAFSEANGDLFKAIEDYNQIILNRKGFAVETGELNDLMLTQESFETVLKDYLQIGATGVPGYFSKLIDVFNLTEGLPAE